jgi:hypothetical protein
MEITLCLIVEHSTLLLFLFSTTLELLGSLQSLEVLGSTLSAFHTQSSLLGHLGLKKDQQAPRKRMLAGGGISAQNRGMKGKEVKTNLLVEDRSGLTTITFLLTDVTSLSQGVISSGTSFVDTDLVRSVLLASPSAQSVLFLGYVYHAVVEGCGSKRGPQKFKRDINPENFFQKMCLVRSPLHVMAIHANAFRKQWKAYTDLLVAKDWEPLMATSYTSQTRYHIFWHPLT